MKTTKIFGQTVPASTTVNGTAFPITAKFDEDGVVQVSTTNSPTVRIQGRASPEAPWINIVLNAAGDTSTTTAGGYFTLPLFPEMRASVTAGVANAVVDIWMAD
jgi:hypothetical protein